MHKRFIRTQKLLSLIAILGIIHQLSYSELQAQEKRTYDVGILIDRMAPQADSLLGRLANEIAAVVGEDAIIRFAQKSLLINNFDLSLAAQHYKQVLSDETDIILAFGPVAGEIVTKQSSHQKPTILFGSINSDLLEIDKSKTNSGIENFTYLITTQSYAKDLNDFKSIYNFDKLGVLIAGRQSTVLPYKETLDQILADLESEYEIIAYTEPSDLTGALDRVDAVYLAEGFDLSTQTVNDIARVLIERKIPSFTSTRREDVENGWMATNQSEENLQQLFRRIALNVEAVVSGENLSERPLYIDQSTMLTINYNTAEAVGVPIKYSSISTTEFVGDFNNVVSEKTYSLVDLIDEVLRQNLNLASLRTDLALSEQDLRTARSSYLPSISGAASGVYLDPAVAEISGGSNPEYSTSGNLTLNQVLFSAGANANIGVQRDLVRAQQEMNRAEELDMIYNAAQAYFSTLSLKTNAQIQAQNLDVTKQNLKIAEQNFEAGQKGKADLLRLRSEAAQNTQSLIEAANQLQQGFFGINQLLNESIDREIDVEEAAIEEGLFENYNYDQLRENIDDPNSRKVFVDFLIEEAIKNAPELRSLDYNLSVVDRNIRLNGSRYFIPTLAAQAQYNRTFDQWGVGAPPPEAMILNDNYNIGLNLSIPIFDQNSRRINKQKGLLQREQLEIRRANNELFIERNVHDAVLDLINQITNIELSKVSEESAEESLELTQTAYATGAVNISQLIDAQRNFFTAQQSRANANYNYLLSSLNLERTIGYFFLLHSSEENDAFTLRYLDYLNSTKQ